MRRTGSNACDVEPFAAGAEDLKLSYTSCLGLVRSAIAGFAHAQALGARGGRDCSPGDILTLAVCKQVFSCRLQRACLDEDRKLREKLAILGVAGTPEPASGSTEACCTFCKVILQSGGRSGLV